MEFSLKRTFSDSVNVNNTSHKLLLQRDRPANHLISYCKRLGIFCNNLASQAKRSQIYRKWYFHDIKKFNLLSFSKMYIMFLCYRHDYRHKILCQRHNHMCQIRCVTLTHHFTITSFQTTDPFFSGGSQICKEKSLQNAVLLQTVENLAGLKTWKCYLVRNSIRQGKVCKSPDQSCCYSDPVGMVTDWWFRWGSSDRSGILHLYLFGHLKAKMK